MSVTCPGCQQRDVQLELLLQRQQELEQTIRTLQEFDWRREPDGVLVARAQADAFCHSMVRALVGATIAVGEGKISVDRLIELRDELARTSEFKVVPSKGLALLEVGYPPDDELAARAIQTRAIRPPLAARAGDSSADAEPSD